MGEVYRAHDAKLDRDVAVKVLPPSVASDPDTLARFEREAKAVAALSHPNILSIFDFGTHDGRALSIEVENEKGDLGVVTQDFSPGRDTSPSRRLTGFTPDSWTESLGVAPDGKHLTVSVLQDSASLLLVEGVEGVVATSAPGPRR